MSVRRLGKTDNVPSQQDFTTKDSLPSGKAATVATGALKKDPSQKTTSISESRVHKLSTSLEDQDKLFAIFTDIDEFMKTVVFPNKEDPLTKILQQKTLTDQEIDEYQTLLKTTKEGVKRVSDYLVDSLELLMALSEAGTITGLHSDTVENFIKVVGTLKVMNKWLKALAGEGFLYLKKEIIENAKLELSKLEALHKENPSKELSHKITEIKRLISKSGKELTEDQQEYYISTGLASPSLLSSVGKNLPEASTAGAVIVSLVGWISTPIYFLDAIYDLYQERKENQAQEKWIQKTSNDPDSKAFQVQKEKAQETIKKIINKRIKEEQKKISSKTNSLQSFFNTIKKNGPSSFTDIVKNLKEQEGCNLKEVLDEKDFYALKYAIRTNSQENWDIVCDILSQPENITKMAKNVVQNEEAYEMSVRNAYRAIAHHKQAIELVHNKESETMMHWSFANSLAFYAIGPLLLKVLFIAGITTTAITLPAYAPAVVPVLILAIGVYYFHQTKPESFKAYFNHGIPHGWKTLSISWNGYQSKILKKNAELKHNSAFVEALKTSIINARDNHNHNKTVVAKQKISPEDQKSLSAKLKKEEEILQKLEEQLHDYRIKSKKLKYEIASLRRKSKKEAEEIEVLTKHFTQAATKDYLAANQEEYVIDKNFAAILAEGLARSKNKKTQQTVETLMGIEPEKTPFNIETIRNAIEKFISKTSKETRKFANKQINQNG